MLGGVLWCGSLVCQVTQMDLGTLEDRGYGVGGRVEKVGVSILRDRSHYKKQPPNQTPLETTSVYVVHPFRTNQVLYSMLSSLQDQNWLMATI